MFDPFFEFMAQVLGAIYDVVPNYALAIMILTLLIMIVLTPLTLKGTRSMIAMQRLQPEMKKLQAKYKDDRQKLNEELMAFYREHKINPVSGCLPLLLQAPVFLVLYQVLYGLTRRAPTGADLGALVGRFFTEGPRATFGEFGRFDPKYLDESSQLWQDLHSSNEMTAFGIDLSNSATTAISEGLVSALPFLVLVILIAVSSYVQQKQVAGRTPQSQISPQQQMLVKVLPLIFVVFSLTLPGGVVLYFLVSNLYRVGQQAFITRTMYRDHTLEPIPATATEAPDQGGDGQPKGLLASLGLTRESLPDLTGKRTTRPEPKPAAAKGGGDKSSGKGSGGAATGTKAKTSGKQTTATTGNGQGGKDGRSGSGPAKSGPAAKSGSGGKSGSSGKPANRSKGKAPTRAAPKPPANRSKSKRKRK